MILSAQRWAHARHLGEYCLFIPSTPMCIFSHSGTPITRMPHGLFPNDHPSFLIIHMFYCLVFLDLKTRNVFAFEKKLFSPGQFSFPRALPFISTLPLRWLLLHVSEFPTLIRVSLKLSLLPTRPLLLAPGWLVSPSRVRGVPQKWRKSLLCSLFIFKTGF